MLVPSLARKSPYYSCFSLPPASLTHSNYSSTVHPRHSIHCQNYKTHPRFSTPLNPHLQTRGLRWLSRRIARRSSPKPSKPLKPVSVASKLLSSRLVGSGFVGPLFNVFRRLKFFKSPYNLGKTSMSINKYVDEQNARDFDQKEFVPDRSNRHDEYHDFHDYDPIPTPSNTPNSSSRNTFMHIRSKAEGLLSQFATKHANASFSRQISRMVTAGAVASGGPVSASSTLGLGAATGPPPKYVEPTHHEELSVYPSYCRKVDHPEYNSEHNHKNDTTLPDNSEDPFPIPYYELDIRGGVTLPPPQNRRTKLALAAARRIAGVSAPRASSSSANFDFYETNNSRKSPQASNNQSIDNFFADLQNIQNDAASENNDADSNSGEKVPPESIPSRPSFKNQPADVLDSRMRPFLCRPIVSRQIDVEVFSQDGQSMAFKSVTETASSGRFNTRIKIPFQPHFARITAGLKHAEIEIEYVSPMGVSVISDIDDTIKITGILGGKRDLFRNVFVNDYTTIEVGGIRDCYAELEKQGATFHYVSNSPWQLYPTVSDYVRSAGFPKGSMHLKTYPNLANGIFEPAAEKKRKNLHQIFRDFPRRSFILFGDSGEGDLEAYLDVATTFPDQVLAIMIRDITLPEHDNSMDAFISMARNGNKSDGVAEGKASEDAGFFKQNASAYQKQMYEAASGPGSVNTSPPPPPPPSRRVETPPLIDLSETADTSTKSKSRPKVPPKPASLQQKTHASSKPPTPPKPEHLSLNKQQSFSFSELQEKTTKPSMANAQNARNMSSPQPSSNHTSNPSANASDIPPPLPKRPDPNLVINSKTRGTIDSSHFLPPPPLPRGTRNTGRQAPQPASTFPQYPERNISQNTYNNIASSSSSPRLSPSPPYNSFNSFNSAQTDPSRPRRNPSPAIVFSSSQDDFSDVLDRRIDGWKDRVHTARARLPAHIVLRMWRDGGDVCHEAQEILEKAEKSIEKK